MIGLLLREAVDRVCSFDHVQYLVFIIFIDRHNMVIIMVILWDLRVGLQDLRFGSGNIRFKI